MSQNLFLKICSSAFLFRWRRRVSPYNATAVIPSVSRGISGGDVVHAGGCHPPVAVVQCLLFKICGDIATYGRIASSTVRLVMVRCLYIHEIPSSVGYAATFPHCTKNTAKSFFVGEGFWPRCDVCINPPLCFLSLSRYATAPSSEGAYICTASEKFFRMLFSVT